jgi:DNA invertase Pin-like site-specific DNA recombinase
MSTDALAFVRVSTGSQDESTQVTTLKEHAPDHDLNIVATWKLHGYSASKGEQDPDLRRAIEGIEQGRWQVIYVTDSSRLDRREDLDVQAEVVLAIRQAGGDVISEAEPQFGKADFAGRVFTLVAQHANAEKSRIGKVSTWRGIRDIITNKAMYGHVPPFWTTVGDRFYKVARCTNPEAVRDAYESVRNGKSLSSIARKYDTYPQSIRRLIKTEANYTGKFECRYTYQGQVYTWVHEAAGEPPVDIELWHAANRVMGERGAVLNNLGGRPVQQATNWYSGLIPCPHCNGNLYPLRGKTLRCSGKGKDRRTCGVCGIDLAYVIEQIEAIVCDEDTKVYRYQRVNGNQGELDELKASLDRLNSIQLTSIPRSDRADHLDRIAKLEDDIDAFELVPDDYQMTPTGETLADLWKTGDKREIFKALQNYIGFNVGWSEDHPEVNGYVWIENFYPGNTLIELTDDTCIKMEVPERHLKRHRAA